MPRARRETKKKKPIEVRGLEPLASIEPWELDLVREQLVTNGQRRAPASEASDGL